ncbi:GNAT family N-acetyltransferase [Facklamia sp. DSM 111018]|uniref:Aminoglycoside N(6')-acetyltransferase type 1 n=1 Tax=Facklamia lactis TaxID=2749967 RepID=A0ABS0LS38_9LACT|nr:aminoglycoside 6'-N-acetyltransferase [Facklamia lactis]MBG9980488.1 GNAT family N-acetyltransferase [Facklamia lactis]MBG9986280.1 GNAT family N-acetyltransferase [Facklamia lactis]
MQASLKDINRMAILINQLWPDLSLEESIVELETYIVGTTTAVFTNISGEECLGLALCSLRNDYVEGCDASPVGYLEGIVVDEKHRMNGIASSLCKECEAWARSKGCKEFASDCELANTNSLKFHLNIGFKEVNRMICFKKTL